MRKWIIGIGVVLLFAGAGLFKVSFMSERPAPAPNNPLFQALDPVQFKAGLSKHRITFINMWASWCGPCKEEFPQIVELRKRHQNEGLDVVLMSVDQPAERGDANAFLLEQKINFPTYFAAEPVDDTIRGIAGEWEGAIPASFLFNAAGEKVDSWQGGGTLADFEAKILPLLAK